MKAKELAQLYKDTPTDETLGTILVMLTKETYEIAKARHSSDSGVPAILDEQERKWKAVVRELPILQEVYEEPSIMFASALKELLPEVYDFWKAPKKGRS